MREKACMYAWVCTHLVLTTPCREKGLYRMGGRLLSGVKSFNMGSKASFKVGNSMKE